MDDFERGARAALGIVWHDGYLGEGYIRESLQTRYMDGVVSRLTADRQSPGKAKIHPDEFYEAYREYP